MGADKLFVGKNPLLLIASVAGIFMYSIYFAYMTCLFLLAYCLITYFVYPRERSVGDFALLAGKFALCLLAGFALVGFPTIPMFITLTSMGRVGIVREIAFFPDGGFLREFCQCAFGRPRGPERFGVGSDSGYCDFGSFVARGSMDERERRAWGCGIALCLIGALVAKVGSVFNGFGYPTDRWEVIFGFCAAYGGCALGARNPSLFGASMEATYRACYRSGCLGLGLRVRKRGHCWGLLQWSCLLAFTEHWPCGPFSVDALRVPRRLCLGF